MLVLDETMRVGGGVTEIGQHHFDVGHLHAALAHPAVNGGNVGLSRARMSATRVRPHPGPGELAQGPPCHEDATSGVAQVDRERAMSRRVAVMYGRPCRLSDNLSCLVHKLNQVFPPEQRLLVPWGDLLADDRISVGQTLYKR